jgi:hypothetical protein
MGRWSIRRHDWKRFWVANDAYASKLGESGGFSGQYALSNSF